MNKTSANKAVEYLIQLGHTKIGGLFEKVDSEKDYMTARYKGYMEALTNHGLPINEDYIAIGRATMSNSADLVNQLLGKSASPLSHT